MKKIYANKIISYIVTFMLSITLIPNNYAMAEPLTNEENDNEIQQSIDTVELENDEEVKKFVGQYKPEHYLLNDKEPIAIGPLDLQAYLFEHKAQQAEAMKNAKKVIKEVAKEFEKWTGRKYEFFEKYKLDDAEIAIVCMNSTAGTTKAVVDELREKSEGRPIGVKFAAGHIEEDLEFACFAKPDFITIDGRGGATGASPKIIKDATTVPTIYALYRARKYLDEHGEDISLVITGGLRTSSDFAKAIAMGADAIAIGTAAMMAIACQQYRVCNNGMCPVGVGTQDSELRKRLNIEKSSKRLENYFNVVNDELKTFARITGNKDIHNLSNYDIVTTNSEISKNTNIIHA